MITRSKMRRQLYMGGGIANLYPRKKFGIGSSLKERFRKLIPNEIADVAVKAAPFVAPFKPEIAALMRGIGRFDQRGSMSDALKQGALTYGFGKAANYGLSQIPTGSGGVKPYVHAPDVNLKAGNVLKDSKNFVKEVGPEWMQNLSKKVPNIPGLGGITEMAKQQLLFGSITGGLGYIYEKFMKEEPPQGENETMEQYLERRRVNVGKKMRTYMDNYLAYDPEYSAMTDEEKDQFVAKYNMNQGGRVGLRHGTPEEGIKSLDAGAPDITYEGNEGPQAPQEEQQMADALLREKYDKYVFDLLEIRPEATPMSFEEFRQMVIAEGKMSGGQPLPEDPTKPINPFAPKPTGPALPDKMMAAKGGRIGYEDGGNVFELLQKELEGTITPEELKLLEQLIKERGKDSLPFAQGGRIGFNQGTQEDFDKFLNERQEAFQHMRLDQLMEEYKKWLKGQTIPVAEAAQGGRIGQLGGTGPAGLPGIPQMAPDGMEFDMRENGGFQGLGAKEKKDDVKALLAKNEFVFTADAVRGAGGGDIELGAQRMYDTMKNLEKRVV
jgi:hypothetical protein